MDALLISHGFTCSFIILVSAIVRYFVLLHNVMSCDMFGLVLDITCSFFFLIDNFESL